MPRASLGTHQRFVYLCTCCILTMTIGGGGLIFTNLIRGEEPTSLYERLGGYDAISNIIDGFLQRMFTDPKVGRYFVGMGTDTRERLQQKNKLLMCKNTGGPCKIINRDMKRTHEGLSITSTDWNIAVSLLTQTLQTLKIKEQEQRELLHLIGSLQEKIVEEPEP